MGAMLRGMNAARLRRSVAVVVLGALIATFSLVSATPAIAAGSGSLTGMVSDRATGLPMSGATLRLLGNSGPTINATTGADGRYAYSSVPVGTYTLTSTNDPYGYVGMEQRVVVQYQGMAVTADAQLDRRSASITGRITDTSGHPIAAIELVSIEPVDVAWVFGYGFTFNPETGIYNIDAFVPGTYDVSAGWENGLQLQTKRVTLGLYEHATVDFVIGNRSLGAVAGSFTAASGPVPKWICVAVVDPTTGQVVGTEYTGRGDGGYYRFSQLPVGTFTIRFRDCDTTRDPSFGTSWLGGSATLAGAASFYMGPFGGLDSYAGNTVLQQNGVFSDVSLSAPFKDEIDWMFLQAVAAGYANADGSRSYHPIEDVSRQAMAAFLYRLSGSPAFTPPVTSSFEDVPTTAPFFREIEWLKSQGIANGSPAPNGGLLYLPTESISRQAMAAFLYRLAGEPEFTPPLVATFADLPADAPFFREVEWMKEEGITNGNVGPDDTLLFLPLDPVSRQSMAAFLYRYAHMMPGTG